MKQFSGYIQRDESLKWEEKVSSLKFKIMDIATRKEYIPRKIWIDKDGYIEGVDLRTEDVWTYCDKCGASKGSHMPIYRPLNTFEFIEPES